MKYSQILDAMDGIYYNKFGQKMAYNVPAVYDVWAAL
jgi:hypothetical protein